jgi:CelD/BcsL family acetyltransferase involved in cellulose biosynthesis
MVRLSGTWPEYLAGLSRVTRKGILRSWRQLEDMDARFRRLDRPDEVRAALAFLIDTKSARLRMVADGSVYERPEVRAFLERAVDGTLASGRLVCTAVEIDGELAAVNLGFRVGERAWAFLDAFDPRWHALGLGGRLVEHAIREGLASGATELWLGQGDSEFKERYASELRTNVDLLVERRWVTATTKAIACLRNASQRTGGARTGDRVV